MRRQLWIPTLLQILILALLPLLVSRASSDRLLDHYPYVWSAQTVIPGDRVRVTITKTKPKLHLARYQRPAVQLVLDDDNTDYYDDVPDIQVGYRRPELVNQTADVELSDTIKLRLALARMKAMEAYHKKWS